ncbi:MAG: maleate isomerase [Ascidiaceihabitans sp.]|jgi:maleate isomerase|tara:strand:- start:888 stop:1658 length:771 start_codon:yes stop_codon:yes gene_type:complete
MHETTGPVITRFDFSTDPDASVRARLGLLVLESDQTMEREIREITDALGVSVYHARLANETVVTSDSLAKMEAELPVAASLLPEYLGLRAIGYGCTSGATVIGEDRIEAILRGTHPDIPSTNPLTAAKAALKALGVERLGLLTPYTPEVTEAMQQRFGEAGIAITVVGSFYEENDIVVGQIDPKSILKAAIALGKSDLCDGIFISCTSLRAAGIIKEAEVELGKPVTASNHALAWHLLRLAGIDDKLADFGRLFSV